MGLSALSIGNGRKSKEIAGNRIMTVTDIGQRGIPYGDIRRNGNGRSLSQLHRRRVESEVKSLLGLRDRLLPLRTAPKSSQ